MSALAVNIVLSAVDHASGDIEGVSERIRQLTEEMNKPAATRAAEHIQLFTEKVKAASQPLADVTRQMIAYAAGLTAVSVALTTQTYQAAVSYESALMDLAKVVAGGRKEAEEYGKALDQMALKYGQNGQDLLASMANFVQAGYSTQEAFTLVEGGVKLMIAGELSASESSNNLISILKGFGAPASEAAAAIDMMNEVSNAYATDVKELATGMAMLSPVAKASGFSMGESAALLTPVIEVYRSGSEAANALKVGLLQLSANTAPVKDALASIGVSQTTLNGELRSGKDIFLDVAGAFTTLGEKEKLHLAAQLFGIEQAGRMSTVMSDLGKYLGVSATAANSAGSAMTEVGTRLQTAQAQIDRTKESFRQLSTTLGNQLKPEITSAVTSVGGMAAAFDRAIQAGSLEPLLGALRPQITAIQQLFASIGSNLEAALARVDWSPLVAGIQNLSASLGGALAALFSGYDLTTLTGLSSAIQAVVNSLANFSQYLAGVAQGLTPLMSGLNLLFAYFSRDRALVSELSGELGGLTVSVNTAVPVVFGLAQTMFAAVGAVASLIEKILILVGVYRVLAFVGVPVAAVLTSIATAMGALSLRAVAVTSVLFGIINPVTLLGGAVLGLGAAIGYSINKMIDWATGGRDLITTIQDLMGWHGKLSDELRLSANAEERAALRTKYLADEQKKAAEAFKQSTAEVNGRTAAANLLMERGEQEAETARKLTAHYAALGMVYDARTGAITKAAAATGEYTRQLTFEEQLTADGVEIFQWKNDSLRKVTASLSGAAIAEKKLAEVVAQAGKADANQYADKLASLRAATAAVINAADAERINRVTVARAMGQDVAAIETEIAAMKISKLKDIQLQYEAHILALNTAARGHLAEVAKIENEIAALKGSTEERIRTLQQSGMSDYAAYQDQQLQIKEMGAAASEALLKGEFEAAQEIYKKQADLASRAARAVSDGDKEVVSKKQAVATAVAQVQAAAEGETQALKAMSDQHQGQADAATQALEQTANAAAAVANQIDSLSGKNTESTHTITANVDEVTAQIAELERDTSSTHTVYVRTVETNATGGVVGRFAKGGAVFPVLRGDVVPGVGNSDSVQAALPAGSFVLRKRATEYYGSLLRFASGGLVNTLLTPGERVFRPETVNRLGAGFFAALNQLRIPREQLNAHLASLTAPIGHFANGGVVASPMSAAATPSENINISLNIGQRHIKMSGARDQAQTLVSALRELQRTL